MKAQILFTCGSVALLALACSSSASAQYQFSPDTAVAAPFGTSTKVYRTLVVPTNGDDTSTVITTTGPTTPGGSDDLDKALVPSATAVPEPATSALLLMAGLGGLIALSRRNRKS